MALTNMKSDPVQRPESTMCAPVYDEPAYPYGLRICLNTESLKKLGMDTLPAIGTKLQLMAVVEVVSVSQNQEKDGEACRSVDLQITDMDLGASSTRAPLETRLYG